MRFFYAILCILELTLVDSLINLNLFEVNKTRNSNGFPKYFVCKFTTFDSNFTILFKSINRLYNEINLKRFSYVFSEYESIDIQTSNSSNTAQLFASSILFLNEESFSNLTRNPDYSNFKMWNLTEDFQINLKLYEKNLHEINKTIFSSLELKLTIYSDPKQKDLSQCYVEKTNKILSFLKDIVRRKRSTTDTDLIKYHLTVEVCIHVQNGVYIDMVRFLGSNDENYIHFYMAIVYAHDLISVNKIYEEINDPLFSLQVQFVKLYLHTKSTNELIRGSISSNQFISNVNKYFNNCPDAKSCDHIVFITNEFEFGLLGLAYVGQVCDKRKTSIVGHHFGSNLDQTIAHELGHNMGAHHDNDTQSRMNA